MHLVTRIWVKQYGDARGMTEKCTSSIVSDLPSDEHANWALWREYLIHALRLLEDDQGCEVEKRSKLSFGGTMSAGRRQTPRNSKIAKRVLQSKAKPR